MAPTVPPDFHALFVSEMETLLGRGLSFGDAAELFQDLFDRDPGDGFAGWCLSTLLLLSGDLAAGWRLREELEAAGLTGTAGGKKRLVQAALGLPSWNGEPLQGRRVVLYANAGAGDAIQFSRYGASLRERGAHVTLLVRSRLAALFSGFTGADRVAAVRTIRLDGCRFDGVAEEELRSADFFASTMSLPRFFSPTAAAIPAVQPYLRPREDLCRRFMEELEGRPGLKVGLCWQGSGEWDRRLKRTPGLDAFAPVLRTPGVSFVCLQMGANGEFGAAIRAAGADVLLDGMDLDAATQPFEETAAVMACLDLVLSTDTSICHLAGATGVPAWLVLPAVPEWRWFLERQDSPWYPTLRLFRCPHPGAWPETMARMARELESIALAVS